MSNYLDICIKVFRQYKQLGEKAMEQLNENQFNWSPSPESNSIALIVKHLHGNMLSRWTDFLTTDGEKEWRNRDSEFETNGNIPTAEINKMWENGWELLLTTLESLTPADLDKTVKIRGEAHSVLEAIQRQTAHYSYHIGQIVYLEKACKDKDWKSLSISKNKSEEFNEKMFGKIQ